MSSEHPARREPVQTRTDYACVIAALAAADGEISEAELDDLRGLCEQLELPTEAVDVVHDFARDRAPDRLRETLRRLRASDLRFTVITDLVVLGLADGTYSMDERKHVRGIATALGVDDDQVVELERFVIETHEERLRLEASVDEPQEVEEAYPSRRGTTLVSEFIARLTGVGVPLAAVLALTPADEISAFTVNAALAKLSVGLGPVPGLGVAVGLGLGTFVGVRWMAQRLRA